MKSSSDMLSSSGSSNTEQEIAQSYDVPFEADIHSIGYGWEKAGEKEGGANSAGDLGGVYVDLYDESRKVLFKKDPVISKNISEFIASKLMRVIMPGAAELFARVELATADDVKLPDETGENVYLASEFYRFYTDLYKDAYKAHNNLPEFFNLVENHGKKPCPLERPKYIKRVGLHIERHIDPVIAAAIKTGRYPNFVKLLVASIFVDDPDVHSANIGVVPKPNETLQKFENGDEIYKRVDAVRIDFGGAFADEKRKLDGELHYKETLRYISLTKKGPPNYLQTYPTTLYEGQDFYIELLKLSCFPPDILINELKNILAEVSRYYGKTPLLEFAKSIGINEFLKQKNARNIADLAVEYGVKLNGIYFNPANKFNLNMVDKETLLVLITIFMGNNLTKRLHAAELEAKKVSRNLAIADEEFDEIKLKTATQVRELLGLQERKQNSELQLSENIVSVHVEALKNMLLPLHDKVAAIVVSSTKKNKEINEEEVTPEEIENLKKRYASEPVKKLISTHFNANQIDYCIEYDCRRMEAIYTDFEEAGKIFVQALGNEKQNAILSLFGFADIKDEDLREEDAKIPTMTISKIEHILSIVANGINEYLSQKKKNKFNMFPSSLADEKEARQALALLKQPIPNSNKFEVICSLFALKNHIPKLRNFLLGKINEIMGYPVPGITIIDMNNGLLHFMQIVMKYHDVELLKNEVSKPDFLKNQARVYLSKTIKS